MGLFKKLLNRKANICVYSEKDQDTYENMVTKHIGTFDEVFHEIVSPDLHIDIIVIPPSADRDHYTLLTMGAGAYKMSVPASYGKMNRAEFAVRLPKNWDIHSNDEKWCWPIDMLKTLARMPYNEKSWLGVYHDVDFGSPFSDETELCCVLLDIFDEQVRPLPLENKDQLIVYTAIPIYRSEMEYKTAAGAEALLQKMSNDTIHGPIDIHRNKVI